MKNPLKRAILEILKNADAPIKEYELHELLGGKAFEQFVLGCSHDLRLFRQHFMVMNALYELHDELLAENIFLHISALEIRLSSIARKKDATNKALLSESRTNDAFARLSDYYLNWDNFNQTNEQDVAKLLNDFWQNYLYYQEKDHSLACLNVTSTDNWFEIKQKYRQLCQKHHPDKGGDKLHFLQIRQAYDNLKQIYSTSTL